MKDKKLRWKFRIGIATGRVRIQETMARDGTLLRFNVAGTPIIHSVRIQVKCRVGGLRICESTWGDLGAELKELFGRVHSIRGKAHERHSIEVRDHVPA